MFAERRWARAFLDACGDKKEDGLAALRVFKSCAGKWYVGTGSFAARRLFRVLREAVEASGGGENAGILAACRTLTLLVQKGLAKYLGSLEAAAEKMWEAENGILTAGLDSAFPLDEGFTDTLKGAIAGKTAVREVRLSVRLMPELIGGCRLHIGTECLDASLRGQLHKMAADLHAAGGFSW
jgi:F-type H+-transporting ATPase subunit delta